ncbi:hypothetical protein KDA82_38035, partial [Streptomyces daliensis]|nr:hypothetical protein [Streptomyces daliensis]
ERYGLRPEEITDDRPFAELGLASADAVSIAAELSLLTGEPLPATLLWDFPTLAQLRRRLTELAEGRGAGETGGAARAAASGSPAPASGSGPGPGAASASVPAPVPVPASAPGGAGDGHGPEAVAVVGLGCRVPGASGPDE